MTLKEYMIDKKEDIKNLKVKERNTKLPLTKSFILTIIGPRRAGKTYSMYDLILNKLKLKEDQYLFLNFEDLELKGLHPKILADSVDTHQQLYGKLPEFLFFDEIQSLKNWESAVYSLFEKKRFYIVLTGSSSKLLSKEIATQLRGRAITYALFPLSFKEFLSFKSFDTSKTPSTYKKNEIIFMLSKYLKTGGFPDVVLDETLPDKFFKDYLDLIIFRDMVERFKIRNVSLIRLLITSLLSSFGKQFSINSIYNQLKSQKIRVSRKTLYSYIELLEDSFFSFLVRKFDFSQKRSYLSIPKVYLSDTGLANNLLTLSFSENTDRLMENCIFIELKRRQNENRNLEVYYLDLNGGEVDFLLKQGPRLKQLIQVTYASSEAEIVEREFKNLISASEKFKCKDLLLITWNYEGKISIKKHAINCIPLWKWLLYP